MLCSTGTMSSFRRSTRWARVWLISSFKWSILRTSWISLTLIGLRRFRNWRIIQMSFRFWKRRLICSAHKLENSFRHFTAIGRSIMTVCWLMFKRKSHNWILKAISPRASWRSKWNVTTVCMDRFKSTFLINRNWMRSKPWMHKQWMRIYPRCKRYIAKSRRSRMRWATSICNCWIQTLIIIERARFRKG